VDKLSKEVLSSGDSEKAIVDFLSLENAAKVPQIKISKKQHEFLSNLIAEYMQAAIDFDTDTPNQLDKAFELAVVAE
jgi:hypothetical protein